MSPIVQLPVARIRPWPVGLLLVMAICLGVITPGRAQTLEPSARIPDFESLTADDYFPLMLRWSKHLQIGDITLRVTYLDPEVALAAVKRATPADKQREEFAARTKGFPDVLQFRIEYQAATREQLRPDAWTIFLSDAAHKSEMRAIKPASAPELQTGGAGEYWEIDEDYAVANPGGIFLPPKARSFVVSARSDLGDGDAVWSFDAVTIGAKSSDDYVVYLGASLTAACAILLAGLLVTRPPRGTMR